MSAKDDVQTRLRYIRSALKAAEPTEATTEALRDVGVVVDYVAGSVSLPLRVSWPRFVATTAAWFAMPFGVLWGLGIPPEAAVRVSVFPMAVMVIAMAAMNLKGGADGER